MTIYCSIEDNLQTHYLQVGDASEDMFVPAVGDDILRALLRVVVTYFGVRLRHDGQRFTVDVESLEVLAPLFKTNVFAPANGV